MASQPLLEVRDATKVYRQGSNRTVGLEGFNLTIEGDQPSITAIAGESGSGKSTLANAVLGFFPLTSGKMLYRGQDISKFKRRDWANYRNRVQAVFQDPYETFNPFFRTRHVFRRYLRRFGADERDRVDSMLTSVGLEGSDVLDKYPHQLSGGQRQRVMMARLMMLKPELVVADEPVSMVDAAQRMQILELLVNMRDQQGISILYITHDLSTAQRITDDIYILYAGRLAETGRTEDVISDPHHPYLQLLIESVPTVHKSEAWQEKVELLPDAEFERFNRDGCLFYGRCPRRMDRCLEAPPPLYPVGQNAHRAACHLHDAANPPPPSRPSKPTNR